MENKPTLDLKNSIINAPDFQSVFKQFFFFGVQRVDGQDFKNLWPSAHENFQTKCTHKPRTKIGRTSLTTN